MEFSIVTDLPGLTLVSGLPAAQIHFQNTPQGKINDKGQLEGFVDAVRSQPQTLSTLDIYVPLWWLLNSTIMSANGRYKEGRLVFDIDKKPVLEATRQALAKLADDMANFAYE